MQPFDYDRLVFVSWICSLPVVVRALFVRPPAPSLSTARRDSNDLYFVVVSSQKDFRLVIL